MWAYPGVGKQLYLATYTGASDSSQVTYPLNGTIADEALSDSEPLADAIQATLQVNYALVPTQTTTIQFSADQSFDNAITLDTLPASATDKTAAYVIREPLNGFIRVYNTSDVSISSIYVNKQVTAF